MPGHFFFRLLVLFLFLDDPQVSRVGRQVIVVGQRELRLLAHWYYYFSLVAFVVYSNVKNQMIHPVSSYTLHDG